MTYEMDVGEMEWQSGPRKRRWAYIYWARTKVIGLDEFGRIPRIR